MSPEVAAHIATIVAAMTGIIVLFITTRQLRLNAEAQKEDAKARTDEANARTASFWLELRKMFAEHDEVHRKLSPGGAWSDEEGFVEKVEEGDKILVRWAHDEDPITQKKWEQLKGPTGEQW